MADNILICIVIKKNIADKPASTVKIMKRAGMKLIRKLSALWMDGHYENILTFAIIISQDPLRQS